MSLCDWLYANNLKWLARILSCKEPAAEQTWSASSPTGMTAVQVSSRYGGAIKSLRWHGNEFVNDTDHGRQIQVALQLDGLGEDCNPTEAGSAADGNGLTSTSSNLAVSTQGNVINTSVLMAYWKPFAGQKVSDCTLSKRVTVNDGHVHLDISLTINSNHRSAAIELLTGYLPFDFDHIEPRILSRVDGSLAMGVRCPTGAWVPQVNIAQDTDKWSMTQGYAPFPAGTYSWVVDLYVGTLDEVRQRLG